MIVSGGPCYLITVSGGVALLLLLAESFKCILCVDLKQIRQNENSKVRLKQAELLMSKGTTQRRKATGLRRSENGNTTVSSPSAGVALW